MEVSSAHADLAIIELNPREKTDFFFLSKSYLEILVMLCKLFRIKGNLKARGLGKGIAVGTADIKEED